MNWLPLVESHRLPAVCGVYLIRHRESGKEYAGRSVNVRLRSMYHRRANTGVTYLYKSIRRHGVGAFDICLFATGTEAEMTALEIEVIASRGTFNPAGYNQTRGGDGATGYRFTAEHRAAISARQTGRPNPPEAIEKMRAARLANNPFKGQRHRPETLEKIREAGRRRAGQPATPALKAALDALAKSRKGKPGLAHTPEARIKISKSKLGVPKPEGFGERLKGKGNPMYGKRGKDCHRAKVVLAWLPGSLTPLTFDTADAAAAWAGCSIGSMSCYCRGTQAAKSGILFVHA